MTIWRLRANTICIIFHDRHIVNGHDSWQEMLITGLNLVWLGTDILHIIAWVLLNVGVSHYGEVSLPKMIDKLLFTTERRALPIVNTHCLLCIIGTTSKISSNMVEPVLVS